MYTITNFITGLALKENKSRVELEYILSVSISPDYFYLLPQGVRLRNFLNLSSKPSGYLVQKLKCKLHDHELT